MGGAAMAEYEDTGRGKIERSPSFPFISIRKAIERAQAVYNNHRREPTRLPALAETWGYSPSSSGLQQTVGALKQFGLLDENGSGADRKVQISDLARTILADLRPGAKEQAISDAARRPRLIADYLQKWVPDRPTDAHCISELTIDRGFGDPAAKLFLKVFDETVAFANLRGDDTDGSVDPNSDDVDLGAEGSGKGGDEGRRDPWTPLVPPPAVKNAGAVPLSERLQVVTTGNQLTISAALVSAKEVDKLIRILKANRELLDDDDDEAEGESASVTLLKRGRRQMELDEDPA
jgi:hypothetical protein